MKSKNFQKSQNKAKIGQKFQKTKIIQNYPKFGFLEIFGFLENLSFFGKFCIFWNKFAVCHFGGYIRTTKIEST
jgi:hypothetical protein